MTACGICRWARCGKLCFCPCHIVFDGASRAVALAAIALTCAACTTHTPRDAAVVAINASTDVANAAESILAQMYKDEQGRCVDPDFPIDSQRRCLATVRKRYDAAWKSYDEFRGTWLIADAGVKGYDIAVSNAKAWKKTSTSPDDLARYAVDLADFEKRFADALAELQGKGK
jgi:hypothetical protein